MKNLDDLQKFRINYPLGGYGDSKNGAFIIPCPATGRELTVIASDGEGWDHVSVSLKNRCPSWVEMDYIKRLFFKADECVLQYHVPEKDHINIHPYCLHLWRPQQIEIIMPPKDMVA